MKQNNTVTAAETESPADYKPQVRTGGLFCRTYHIEMQKILKRWDTLLLLLGAAIPLALSISLASHASFLKISAATKIDSAQFLVIITQMVASVCIFHLIAALYAARFYCSEVENNSILLYVPRICNRGIQYCAKFLALLTAVAAAQIIIGLDIDAVFLFYCSAVPTGYCNGSKHQRGSRQRSCRHAFGIFVFLFGCDCRYYGGRVLPENGAELCRLCSLCIFVPVLAQCSFQSAPDAFTVEIYQWFSQLCARNCGQA